MQCATMLGMNMSQQQGPVVVLGSKVNAALPAVHARAVLTANSAAELGLLYKQRYGSYTIAVTSSRVVRDETYVQDAFKKSKPDEVVLLGSDLPDPASFIHDTLGLVDTKVTVVSPQERNELMTSQMGWRRFLLMTHILVHRGIRHLVRYAIPDYFFGGRNRTWLNRTTGMNAVLYAMKHFPDTKEIITAGIDFNAGGHFNGLGKFLEKDALADRTIMRYWTPEYRKNVYTTDDVAHAYGNIPKWKGDVFYFKKD